MADLKRSLRLFDGLAMVVGIMVGSGIFRTPGLVAAQLGRPWLTFVAWVAGAGLALVGALTFAELATRLPKAGGRGDRDRLCRWYLDSETDAAGFGKQYSGRIW